SKIRFLAPQLSQIPIFFKPVDNKKTKNTRPQGISFPEPLEPPPSEIYGRYRYLFRLVIGYTI
ncbi:TPA: hypothetical protein ACGDWP_003796, partial [Acinetobacter baumannii]